MLPRKQIGLSLLDDIRERLFREPIRIIFDVGANVGQSARELRRRYPEAAIYCFEPDPETFKILASLDIAVCFNVGLGSSRGVFRFDNREPNSTMRQFQLDRDDEALPMIEIDTLDSICTMNNISHIDLLKIDTEGDLMVLKGASEMLREFRVGIAVAECSVSIDNRFHAHFSEVHCLMEAFGYRLFGIYEQVHEWPSGRPQLRRVNAAYISRPTIERNILK
jgi:FkbM family methyltransferase